VRIRGFLPTSFLDWDGRLVSVIFLGGCNFNCPFCHNYLLLSDGEDDKIVPWPVIADHLKGHRNWLDGVVITGGEPLFHPEVFGLCRAIKDLGFAVKLDTNGSFPYGLMRLCREKLVDYVALDLKTAPDERYDKACGTKVEVGLIKRSMQMLLEGSTAYELRTTMVPGLVGKDEIAALAKLVNGAGKFALQQFVPGNARLESYRKKKPYDRGTVDELASLLRPKVKELTLRGKLDED
jgi:pyruvate formate lyase activating enzyme